MARPANAAVRESRRRSTPLDVERMNVMKALTAAEYSRRQFILNFAASRDTQLLIPGQKSDAVKAAEEWVAVWLNQTGFDNVNNEFFKYTVDARLWIAHVGGDVDFPFAFMRGSTEGSSIGASSVETEVNRPKSEVFLDNHISKAPNIDLIAVEPLTAEPETASIQARFPTKQQPRQSAPSSPQVRRRRSTKQRESAEGFSDRKRSMSMPSFEELKTTKSGREKFPFLQRLGRSLSRRMSST